MIGRIENHELDTNHKKSEKVFESKIISQLQKFCLHAFLLAKDGNHRFRIIEQNPMNKKFGEGFVANPITLPFYEKRFSRLH